MQNKPKWYKKPIENKLHRSCPCCGVTAQVLELDTKLYFGFGGWTITKNNEEFFIDRRDVEFDEYKDLNHVEELIGDDIENEYIAELSTPLRGAIYQRHGKNNWVLISTNIGFA